MENQAREGANRPLSICVPKNAGTPAEEAKQLCNKNPESWPARRVWAAVLSYPLAYLYIRMTVGAQTFFLNWQVPAFAMLFLAGVELLARAARRTPAAETLFWAVCWLAQSIALPLWGWQGGGLFGWQLLAWHLTAIWYVLARTGMLAAGHSGSLSFLDGIAGILTLPFGNFFRRLLTLGHGLVAWYAGRCSAKRGRRWRIAVASTAAAVLVCLYAGSQLAAVDANFAALGARLFDGLADWWEHLWGDTRLALVSVYFVLSLPVGAWLFGLVSGGLRRSEPPLTEKNFFAALAPLQKLPALTVRLVLGALCALYGVFFAVQAAGFAGTFRQPQLSGTQVSSLAVDGFWELCRVLLLNFSLLACIRFFGNEELHRRNIRTLQGLFGAFGVAFALLAGGKLAFYVSRYGWTSRRAIAVWALCVLAVWAVLALVWALGWPVRRFGPAQAGILVLAASFTLLCCVNMNSLVLRANVQCYTAGRSDGPDLAVLRACGAESYGARAEEGARLLADAGWFEGKTDQEIRELYAARAVSAPENGTAFYELNVGGGAVLAAAFRDGVCAGAWVESSPGVE